MSTDDRLRPPSRRSEEALAERRVSLPPRPESTRLARRLLREALADAGRDAWLDDAELALSEVVTNAALHAHTDIDVHIEVCPAAVCVEVRDFDPTMPVERGYGTDATTGRGMGLVSAVTSRCGVRSLGEAGKIVWFCLGDDRAAPSADELLAAWDVDDWEEDDAAAAPEGAEIVLLSMPVNLWLSAREHHDAIIRELGYHLAEHPGADLDIPAADRARSRISTALVAAMGQADTSGGRRPVVVDGQPMKLPWTTERLDLRVSVPAADSWMFGTMQDVLDHAEVLACQGRLLVAPALPEIVAVRDWACEQVVAQLGGSSPTPWEGAAQPRFETTVRGSAVPVAEWDTASVTGADWPVIAADDSNRIIAVSQPLADLLGWPVDRLVGRRVVTIVPHSWREAHVAGFSRHLSTGETSVLGVPVELPVLAADGSEILCDVLIERATDNPGRPVYVARMAPIEDR